MKKNQVILLGLCGTLMISSCTTSSAGAGAMNGAMLGGWFGSAIGGIVGGPYGHDVGTVIGMTTGAVAGAAVGQAEENNRRAEVREHYRRVHGNDDMYGQYSSGYNNRQYSSNYSQNYGNSGFDSSNSGDDRLYDFQSSDYTGSYSSSRPVSTVPTQSQIEIFSPHDLSYSTDLEISNARFIDDNNDGMLRRGEKAKIIFEIKNTSKKVLYDLVPTVVEMTQNKHIAISPSMHIESIAPGQKLRYTAVVVADRYIGNGQVVFSASVVQGSKTISKVSQFNVMTKKK